MSKLLLQGYYLILNKTKINNITKSVSTNIDTGTVKCCIIFYN